MSICKIHRRARIFPKAKEALKDLFRCQITQFP
ncbi:hypothetical protein PDIG_68220 [Penicillium digitatum PHI26]|uniref:Uncharacterized protein n=2 Tax=Penicillium digitatum TaxID=36651 RepID=K9FJM1_PEND2|nr:hypothetical protein PDIP_77510 [Penicillium digitatum Pd1]EKV06715.1 hypothetical protein PDIP_77510 [Penicillium digitatum Pd1]EKV08417.1 hypothetical protein PDIG_68220 [Penicillium digitatum PHI26]